MEVGGGATADKLELEVEEGCVEDAGALGGKGTMLAGVLAADVSLCAALSEVAEELVGLSAERKFVREWIDRGRGAAGARLVASGEAELAEEDAGAFGE